MGLARRAFNIGFVSLTCTITESTITSLASTYNLGSKRSLGTLAFEEVQVSTNDADNENNKPYKPTAFILHGLLGSGRNWRSFSRNLAFFLSSNSASSPEWKMVLVDLRNHGKSSEVESINPPHDLVNAANDLANLIKRNGWDWPSVVMGHSLGGKVAMQFAQSCAQGDYGASARLPKQLWVLDSVPGVVSAKKNDDGEVEKVLRTLQSLPPLIPSRQWLVDHLVELGFSKSLSQWLGTNLKKSGDQETWAFNLEGAVQMFNSYREKDYWSLLENPPKEMDISIVQAEKSDRWEPEVLERLRSLCSKEGHSSEGKVSLHVLPNAGHWVHVDNPKGLLEIIGPRMASLS